MLLTNSEISGINQNAEFDSAIGYARAIEAAVLEKLKEQEPYAYVTYKGHLLHAADPKVLEHSEPEPLYLHPFPPNNIVRDAFKAGLMYASNKYEQVREERFSGGDVADFLFMECKEMDDATIDAAMEKMK